MAKINISIDDKLLDRLDRVAENLYMSRSGLISVACTKYINSDEILLSGIYLLLENIEKSGKIDHEAMEKLSNLEGLCKILLKS